MQIIDRDNYYNICQFLDINDIRRLRCTASTVEALLCDVLKISESTVIDQLSFVTLTTKAHTYKFLPKLPNAKPLSMTFKRNSGLAMTQDIEIISHSDCYVLHYMFHYISRFIYVTRDFKARYVISGSSRMSLIAVEDAKVVMPVNELINAYEKFGTVRSDKGFTICKDLYNKINEESDLMEDMMLREAMVTHRIAKIVMNA